MRVVCLNFVFCLQAKIAAATDLTINKGLGRTLCRYSSNHHDWSLDINMKIFYRALNIASKLVIRAQDVGKTRLEEDFGGFYSKL